MQADQAVYASSTASAEFAEAAFHADSADSATKATQDGQGRDIASTYALKSEVGSKMYRHFITIRNEDDPDYGVGIFCYKSSRSAKFTTVDELYDELNAKGFNNSNAVYPATGSYGPESSGTALLYLRADLYTIGTGGSHTRNIKRIIFYTAKGEGLRVYSSDVNYDQGIVTDIVMDD